MKKFFAAIICLLLAIAPSAVFAQEAFDILKFDINIDVSKKRVSHFDENFTLFFHDERHGIYRDIPIYPFGSTGNDPYAVKNVKVVGDPYSTQRDGRYMSVKIGDADKYISGEKNYRISYDLVQDKDNEKHLDFIYINLFGESWDTTSDLISINVTLPAKPSNYTVTSGKYGDTGNPKDLVITEREGADGKYHLFIQSARVFENYEAITLQAEFPEGTFSSQFEWLRLLGYGIALFVLIFGLAVFIINRPAAVLPVVEFFPPDGLNPTEIGTIIDRKTDPRDVTSLIIYWASHNHLTIKEEKKEFTLIKNSDLDDKHTEYEKYAYSLLFAGGVRNWVTSKDLEDTYFSTVEKTQHKVGRIFEKGDRMLEEKSVPLRTLMYWVGMLGLILSFFIAYIPFQPLALMAIVPSIAAFIAGSILFARSKAKHEISMSKGKNLSAFSLMGSLLGAVILGIVCYIFFYSLGWPYSAIISAASLLILALAGRMGRLTQYGESITGRVLGFRNFLELAEKDRLKELLEQSPSYFYDILPYAMVLGVTSQWASKFDSLLTRPPDWYQSDRMNTFTPLIFSNSLNRTSSSIRSSMVSKPAPEPSSSPGGGSGGSYGGFSGGGGGFSGGGGGGGGGRSW